MESISIEPFNIIGISVKTDNNDGLGSKDIPELWHKFLTESIRELIPNKIDDKLYCLYTDYEGDYTKPYTALLGCKVANLEQIPPGLVGMNFSGGKYEKHIAQGNIMHGIIFKKWQYIWGLDISRAYICDFEVYGEKAQNFENAEVEIFIGLK